MKLDSFFGSVFLFSLQFTVTKAAQGDVHICENAGQFWSDQSQKCASLHVCMVTYATNGNTTYTAEDAAIKTLCEKLAIQYNQASFGVISGDKFKCLHKKLTLKANYQDMYTYIKGANTVTNSVVRGNATDQNIIKAMDSECNYDVFFDIGTGQSWAGKGAVSGRGISIDGDLTDNINVIIHELGHNLGLKHANTYNATNHSFDAYADLKDYMGSSNNDGVDFGTQNKYFFGWVPFSKNTHFTGGESSNTMVTLHRADNGQASETNPVLPSGIISVTHTLSSNGDFPYNSEAPENQKLVYMFDFAHRYLKSNEKPADFPSMGCVSVHVVNEISDKSAMYIQGIYGDDNKLRYKAGNDNLDGDNTGASSLEIDNYGCMQIGESFTDPFSNLLMNVVAMDDNSATIEIVPIEVLTTNTPATIGTSIMLAVMTILSLVFVILLWIRFVRIYKFTSLVAKIWYVGRVFGTIITFITWCMVVNLNLTYNFAKDGVVWVAFYMLLAHFFYFLVISVVFAVLYWKNATIITKKPFAWVLFVLDFLATFFVGVAAILLASVTYNQFSEVDENTWITSTVFAFLMWLLTMAIAIHDMLFIISIYDGNWSSLAKQSQSGPV